MESCHLAAARRVKLWSQNANLFVEEPHQLTEFVYHQDAVKTFAFLSFAEERNSSCPNVQHNILASVNFLNIFLSKFSHALSTGIAVDSGSSSPVLAQLSTTRPNF